MTTLTIVYLLAQSFYAWLGPARAADNIRSPKYGIAVNTQSLQFLTKRRKADGLAKLAGWGITAGPAVDVLTSVRDIDWGSAVDHAYDIALASIGGPAEPPNQVVIQPEPFWSSDYNVWATGTTFLDTGVIWVVGLYVSETTHFQQEAWDPASADGCGSLLLWEMENWIWFKFHGGTAEYHPPCH